MKGGGVLDFSPPIAVGLIRDGVLLEGRVYSRIYGSNSTCVFILLSSMYQRRSQGAGVNPLPPNVFKIYEVFPHLDEITPTLRNSWLRP